VNRPTIEQGPTIERVPTSIIEIEELVVGTSYRRSDETNNEPTDLQQDLPSTAQGQSVIRHRLTHRHLTNILEVLTNRVKLRR